MRVETPYWLTAEVTAYMYSHVSKTLGRRHYKVVHHIPITGTRHGFCLQPLRRNYTYRALKDRRFKLVVSDTAEEGAIRYRGFASGAFGNWVWRKFGWGELEKHTVWWWVELEDD